MQRIYLPNMQFSGNLTISDIELYHQLTRVLRARVGQEVVFFDGKVLKDYVYTITHIDKKGVILELGNTIEKSSEISNALTLYQALPNKLEKLEYIVQKCCEIGYKKIVFFSSERSQKIILSEKKQQRILKIAIEAIEQCGGNIIPEIEYAESFSGNLTEFKSESILSVICHTQEENSQKLSDIVFKNHKNIQVFVGPEGGFSEVEISYFEGLGIQKVYFGNRILRCETVGEVLGFYISYQKK